jgi:hypothetical protein
MLNKRQQTDCGQQVACVWRGVFRLVLEPVDGQAELLPPLFIAACFQSPTLLRGTNNNIMVLTGVHKK